MVHLSNVRMGIKAAAPKGAAAASKRVKSTFLPLSDSMDTPCRIHCMSHPPAYTCCASHNCIHLPYENNYASNY